MLNTRAINYFEKTTNASQTDHIYINIPVLNDSYTNMMPLNNIAYQRDDAVLRNTGMYKLAVSKLYVDTYGGGIPLMIPELLVDGANTDPNKLAYSFTMRYYVSSTEVYQTQQFVEFVPQNTTAVPPYPSGPIAQQSSSTNYYHLYSFKYFVSLLNNTLATAYNAIKGSADPSSYPPFLTLSDNILVFNADKAKYNVSNTPRLEVYCNTPMMRLLTGFDWIPSSGVQGKNFMLNIIDDGTNTLSLADYDALVNIQSYSSIGLWNCVQSVILATNTLPVVPEIQGTLVVQEPKEDYNTSNRQSYSIITNFNVDVDSNPLGYFPSVSFGTLNSYRFSDLQQIADLKAVSVGFFWRDYYNNIYPMYLPPQGRAYVELAFINTNLTVN